MTDFCDELTEMPTKSCIEMCSLYAQKHFRMQIISPYQRNSGARAMVSVFKALVFVDFYSFCVEFWFPNVMISFRIECFRIFCS